MFYDRNIPTLVIPFTAEKRYSGLSKSSGTVRTELGELGSTGDTMKVFVVDDSTVIRERLKRMLADEDDVEVIGEAGDALQAVDAILDAKPDAVLLDIQLLNGSGIEVLERLKKTQAPPAVIMLTDYPYPEYRQLSTAAGADFFFVKSNEFDKVIPALKQIMQKASNASQSERL